METLWKGYGNAMEDAERLFDEIDKIAPRLSAKKKAEIVEAAWNWARERNLRAMKAVALGGYGQRSLIGRYPEYSGVCEIVRVTTPSTKA
jgi:hypothetical protein